VRLVLRVPLVNGTHPILVRLARLVDTTQQLQDRFVPVALLEKPLQLVPRRPFVMIVLLGTFLPLVPLALRAALENGNQPIRVRLAPPVDTTQMLHEPAVSLALLAKQSVLVPRLQVVPIVLLDIFPALVPLALHAALVSGIHQTRVSLVPLASMARAWQKIVPMRVMCAPKVIGRTHPVKQFVKLALLVSLFQQQVRDHARLAQWVDTTQPLHNRFARIALLANPFRLALPSRRVPTVLLASGPQLADLAKTAMLVARLLLVLASSVPVARSLALLDSFPLLARRLAV
jgi:hypothetical protein